MATFMRVPWLGAEVMVSEPPSRSACSRILVRPKPPPFFRTLGLNPWPLSVTSSLDPAFGVTQCDGHGIGRGMLQGIVQCFLSDMIETFYYGPGQIDRYLALEMTIDARPLFNCLQPLRQHFGQSLMVRRCRPQFIDQEPRLLESLLGCVTNAREGLSQAFYVACCGELSSGFGE